MHFATIFGWFPRCVCYYMKCVCIASLLHDCVLKGWKAEAFFYSEGYVEWTQSTIQQSLKGTYQQIWIPFHQEWFVPSLVGSEEENQFFFKMSWMWFHYSRIFFPCKRVWPSYNEPSFVEIAFNWCFWRRGFLKCILAISFSKNDLCQVRLK